RGLQIRPSHVFGRCTDPIFSHIHVSLTCLQPMKDTTTFGYLREFGPWRFHQRSTSRHPCPRSWDLFPKVLIFEFMLSGSRSPPSARRKWHPSVRRSWCLGLCL